MVSSDTYVCADCVEDYALQKVVRDNLNSKTCDYCDETSESDLIACSLEHVTDHIERCLRRVYTDPAEVLPYDSREGGYQLGTIWYSRDLFSEVGLEIENEQLIEDIISFFDFVEWAKENWQILSPDERAKSGWGKFKHTVKHTRRFTFWSAEDDSEEDWHPDHWPIGNTLEEVASFIRNAELIKTIPLGYPFWRVRVHSESKELKMDKDLASPPLSSAIQTNRMSPAGISMFYGAEDYLTACVETLDSKRTKGKAITGGYFRNTVPLNLLDLDALPFVPSFFDIERFELRYHLIFLHEFVKDLSAPIERDDRVHIEYVPTQAFTEYVRWEMQNKAGELIHGICYPSSKNDRKCYVLFCGHDQCIQQPASKAWMDIPKWLELDATSLRREKCSEVLRQLREQSTGDSELFL